MSTPGAGHVAGSQFTGQTDPAQTGKVTSGSMFGVGAEAKAQASASFQGYNNDPASQASQGVYFMDKNAPMPGKLSSSDPMFTRSVPTDVFASSSATACQQSTSTINQSQTQEHQCIQSYTPYTLSCSSQTTVVDGGTELACVSQSFRCIPGGGSCCNISISCNSSNSANVTYSDCCGSSWTRTATSADFAAGVQINPAGAKLTCDAGGACREDFVNYYCNSTYSIGATPNYACPTNYTLSGTTCSQQVTQSQAADIASYSCPAGYTNNNNGTCSQQVTNTQSATVSYSCPAGYTNNNNGTCSQQVTQSQAADIAGYSCPAGYTNNNDGTCSQVFIYSQAASISGETCPAGTTNNGSGICVSSRVTYVTATTGNTCPTTQPDNYVYRSDLGKCYSAYWNSEFGRCLNSMTPQCMNACCNAAYGRKRTVTPTVSSMCPGNTADTTYTNNGNGTCTQTTTTTSAAQPNYVCPTNYTLSGSTCSTQVTNTQSATGSAYSCPAGFTLSGSTCSRQVLSTQSATVSYSCPAGYTLSGTTCSQQVTNTQSATVSAYSCPVGFTLSGSTCSRQVTNTQGATISSYSCPDGYLLTGTSCMKSAGIATYNSVAYFSLGVKQLWTVTKTDNCAALAALVP
jgi:conjugal transfer mating pair stabilization protein TraN